MFGIEPFFVRLSLDLKGIRINAAVCRLRHAQTSLRGGLSWLRYVALNHVVAGSIPAPVTSVR